jgi:hypothetical protein
MEFLERLLICDDVESSFVFELNWVVLEDELGEHPPIGAKIGDDSNS